MKPKPDSPEYVAVVNDLVTKAKEKGWEISIDPKERSHSFRPFAKKRLIVVSKGLLKGKPKLAVRIILDEIERLNVQ